MPPTARPRVPGRTRLALEVLLALAALLLDARDLWFKLRWIGPRDAFAFSTRETVALQARELIPATNGSLVANQAIRQPSGWLAFLDKCESLTALEGDRHASAITHVLARNCVLGPASRPAVVPELVLSGSQRADAVAWAACELLLPQRKPPMCHSSVVTQFRARHALDAARAEDRADGLARAEPGGEAEMELLELLNVVSRSVPLAGVVCVEGFAHKGPGRYAAEIFGCGSPSRFRSALAGQLATSLPRLLQDKAWLTSDALHAVDMALLVRSNARSEFLVSPAAEALVVHHGMRLNVSCSGALYSLMVLIDLSLLVLGACSAAEVARWMLWPVWSAAQRGELCAGARSFSTKLGLTLDDYRDVLRASQLRSPPVTLLAALARLLTWVAVLPLAPAALGGGDAAGDAATRAHVLLSLARLWLLALLALHAAWDAVVAADERRALRVARGTFVRQAEVAVIAALIGYSALRGAAPRLLRAKRLAERQRTVDARAFRDAALGANTFPEALGSLQTSPAEVWAAVFAPLGWAVALSVAAAAVLAAARFGYLRLRLQSVMDSHLASLKASAAVAAVAPDAAEGLDPPGSPPASPSKLMSYLFGANAAANAGDADAGSADGGSADGASPPPRRASVAFASIDASERLPLEALVDEPVRARSLVRDALFMERSTGQQVALRPALLLEFGLVLHGKALRTRCGFVDAARTQLRACDHALAAAAGGSRAAERLSEAAEPQMPLR